MLAIVPIVITAPYVYMPELHYEYSSDQTSLNRSSYFPPLVSVPGFIDTYAVY